MKRVKKVVSMFLSSLLLLLLLGTFSLPSNVSAKESVKLSASKKTIYINQKHTLKIQKTNVIWKSSKPSVVKVNQKGVIVGKRKGTAKISVISKSTKKTIATCKINVKDYGKKKVDFSSEAVVYEVSNKGKTENGYANLEQTIAISNVKERNRFIRFIRNNYPEGENAKRSDVIKTLKKYNKKFFEEHVLLYSMSVAEGVPVKYVEAQANSVVKKYSGGKLTALVKTQYAEVVPEDVAIDSAIHTRFQCYFTAVKKTDIKGVEVFKHIDKEIER